MSLVSDVILMETLNLNDNGVSYIDHDFDLGDLALGEIVSDGELELAVIEDAIEDVSAATSLASRGAPATTSCTSSEVLTNDIGDAVGDVVMSTREKYNLLCHPWRPPKSYNFPTKTVGSRLRKFQASWLTEFPWLSFSKKKNGAFCKHCVLFAGPQASDYGQLVTEPLQDFAKGKKYLEKHSTRKYHQFAEEKAFYFKENQNDKSLSISEIVNAKAEIEKERIRNGLKAVVKAAIYLARQGQPFRGHRYEQVGSVNTGAYDGSEVSGQNGNPGNFLSLLEILSSSDDLLAEHIRKSPKNRLYITKSSQNKIIKLVGDQIAENIVREVQQADWFSLMCDECGDRSNLEQLAITIRYVLDDKVKEKFLCLVECHEGATGETISNMVLEALELHGLCKQNMIALTTDGAGNMTGRIKGAATIMQQEVTSLQHIHCLAHVLNLTILTSCKNQFVQSMFTAVQSAYSFFSQSPKRTEALKSTIEKSERGDRVKLKLKEVCRTRWVERYNALETMLILLPDVIHTLERILAESEWNKDTQDKASSLLEALTTYKFLVVLVTATNILLTTKGLCKKLQGRAYDIVSAMGEIDITISRLEILRESCFYERNSDVNIWFEDINDLAEKLEIEPCMPRVTKKQMHRTSVAADTPRVFYIRNMILPFIDDMVNELKERYNLKNKNLLLLFALAPSAIMRIKSRTEDHSFDAYYTKLKPGLDTFAHLLRLPDAVVLKSEVHLWYKKWMQAGNEGDSITTSLTEALNLCDQEYFPCVHSYLKIMATTPVSSCEAERLFSQMKLVKSSLRSTMTSERLDSLLKIKVHRDYPINIDSIVNAMLR